MPNRVRKQGWLVKRGQKFGQSSNRFFVIEDNFLYTYQHESHYQRHKKPTNVLFLDGCFIESVP